MDNLSRARDLLTRLLTAANDVASLLKAMPGRRPKSCDEEEVKSFLSDSSPSRSRGEVGEREREAVLRHLYERGVDVSVAECVEAAFERAALLAPSGAGDVSRAEIEALAQKLEHPCDHKRQSCEDIGCEGPLMREAAAKLRELVARLPALAPSGAGEPDAWIETWDVAGASGVWSYRVDVPNEAVERLRKLPAGRYALYRSALLASEAGEPDYPADEWIMPGMDDKSDVADDVAQEAGEPDAWRINWRRRGGGAAWNPDRICEDESSARRLAGRMEEQDSDCETRVVPLYRPPLLAEEHDTRVSHDAALLPDAGERDNDSDPELAALAEGADMAYAAGPTVYERLRLLAGERGEEDTTDLEQRLRTTTMRHDYAQLVLERLEAANELARLRRQLDAARAAFGDDWRDDLDLAGNIADTIALEKHEDAEWEALRRQLAEVGQHAAEAIGLEADGEVNAAMRHVEQIRRLATPTDDPKGES